MSSERDMDGGMDPGASETDDGALDRNDPSVGTTGALRLARERWSEERGLPERPPPSEESAVPVPGTVNEPEIAFEIDRLPGERLIWSSSPDRLIWASGELTSAGQMFFLNSRLTMCFLASLAFVPFAFGSMSACAHVISVYRAYVASTSVTHVGSVLGFAPSDLAFVLSAAAGVFGVATLRVNRRKHLFALTTHRALRLEDGRVEEVIPLESIAAIEPTRGWARGALLRGVPGMPDVAFFGLGEEARRALGNALEIARPHPPRVPAAETPPSKTTGALLAARERQARRERDWKK